MSVEKKYFEREYQNLKAAGQEFAQQYPEIGKELGLDPSSQLDPFVERVLEGFAFLAGRIHARLDDDLPEFTGALLEQLFPHFLRPFPCCAILQATCNPGVAAPIVIPRGSHIRTPMREYLDLGEKAEFTFRTTRDLIVRPMQLTEATLEATEHSTSALLLKFKLERNVAFEMLKLENLSLYLYGPDSLSLKHTLFLYLSKYVSDFHVIAEQSGKKQSQKMSCTVSVPELFNELQFDDGSHDSVRIPIDMQEEGERNALLPFARQVFGGYRLLQEYLAFPEKFHFIEIKGLDQAVVEKSVSQFTLKIDFDRPYPIEYRPAKENLRLHCSPIINLFDGEAEPVVTSNQLPEYRIIPKLSRPKSMEIYSVNQVVGTDLNTKESTPYLPITSHTAGAMDELQQKKLRFFSQVRRETENEMARTYLRLFGVAEGHDYFQKESLLVQATFSNGFLPGFSKETISEPIDFPVGVGAENILAPSAVLRCPDRANFLWTLIAHLSLSYTSLAETETLKKILHLYNWSREHNNRNAKRINAIKQVAPPVRRRMLYSGSMIHGIQIELTVDVREFINEGDLFLFGLVLSKFLSQYVTINSFVILIITDSESNKKYTWTPNLGKILPV